MMVVDDSVKGSAMTTMTSARVAVRRAHDPLDSWTIDGPRVPPSDARAVGEVLDRATALLDWTPAESAVLDYSRAGAALSELSRLVIDALRGDDRAVDRVRTTDLTNLLRGLQCAHSTLHDSRLRQRERIMRRVGGALDKLSGATTPAQLATLGVEALCEVGFDRAIAGDVRDSVWHTRTMCVRGDPEWAAEIVSVANPRRLRSGLVEAEATRRRSAIVVTNVQSESHVHRQIAEASLSRSYVTAPVLVEGRVVGLLHADCYFQRRNVDDFDRDVLGTFASGYGFALHRTMLQTRLAALRESVGQLTGELTATVEAAVTGCELDGHRPDECLVPPCGVDHRDGGSVGSGPTRSGSTHRQRGSALSSRELDVLRLMAAGDTNTRIATRLVLAEGTVKTHVRNILRKLGAANRAEAVTRWLSGAHCP
jgi:DNA-binding CsgD family transcriptional regulator/GAF domain-containing protein